MKANKAPDNTMTILMIMAMFTLEGRRREFDVGFLKGSLIIGLAGSS